MERYYICFDTNSLLNNIQFCGYINPLVYLILIITLPQDTEKWFIIIIYFSSLVFC